jgi:hypothetical protein
MQDAGRHGPTWRVLLSVTPSSMHSMNGATPSTSQDGPALLEALRMLDALRQENRDLAGQVGYLQARVQMQEATILALQAPEEPQNGTLERSGTAELPDPSPGSHPRHLTHSRYRCRPRRMPCPGGNVG